MKKCPVFNERALRRLLVFKTKKSETYFLWDSCAQKQKVLNTHTSANIWWKLCRNEERDILALLELITIKSKRKRKQSIVKHSYGCIRSQCSDSLSIRSLAREVDLRLASLNKWKKIIIIHHKMFVAPYSPPLACRHLWT